MRCIFPAVILALLIGCASPHEKQIYWDSQRALLQLEQQRLHDIYRSEFKRGFGEAWVGHATVTCILGDSTEPAADIASQQGYRDGHLIGSKARVTQGIETHEEQERRLRIYRTAFQKGFLEAWNEHQPAFVPGEPLLRESKDLEGELALNEGYMDGYHFARIARETQREQELKQAQQHKR